MVVELGAVGTLFPGMLPRPTVKIGLTTQAVEFFTRSRVLRAVVSRDTVRARSTGLDGRHSDWKETRV